MLRALTAEAPEHPQAKALLFRMKSQDYELVISRQVIREYLVQITRPQTYSQPLAYPDVQSKMQVIQRLFKIVDDTEAVTSRLLQLLKDFPTQGKQIHDANIVAAMLVNGSGTLLTINLRDMKRFEPLISIITP